MENPLTQITFQFSAASQTENNNSTVIENETAVMVRNEKEMSARDDQQKTVISVKRGRKPFKRAGTQSGPGTCSGWWYSISKNSIIPSGKLRPCSMKTSHWSATGKQNLDILQPRKNRKGDRFFRPIDIKKPGHESMTCSVGANSQLKAQGNTWKRTKKPKKKFAAIKSLEKIREFLLELKATL